MKQNITLQAINDGIHISKPFFIYFQFNQVVFFAKMPKYGFMETRRELTEREEQILNQNLIDIIQIDDWWLAQNQYSCGEYWRIFQVCDQITAKAIDFNENQRKQIIRDIIHIGFPHITSINFSTNNIQSIEQLQYLNAPNLQHLTLTFNNISEAKTLRKCYFPNLKGLYLHSNFIVQLKWLQSLNCKKLENLTLEYRDNQENPVILEDIAILFKLNSLVLKNLEWASSRSINTSAKFAMLGQKYNKITPEKLSL